MLEYLHASNFTAAYNALKEDSGSEYTPDPKAKYAGLLEKKWTSVIRLQKKVRIQITSLTMMVSESCATLDHGS